MINQDTLVKYSIKRLSEGYQPCFLRDDWVDYARLLEKQVLECKLGFPGIGSSDLSIIESKKLRPSDRAIFCSNLDGNSGVLDSDDAPILVHIHSVSDTLLKGKIEGFGRGYDLRRDPDRLMKWGDLIEIRPDLFHTVLRLDSKPRPDGGPVYYYYNKHPRDERY